MYSQKEAARAAMIIKKREQEHQELKARKRKIEEDMRIGNISNKFAVHTDFNEIKLKSDTIGLVSLDEMKAKEKDIIEQRKKKLAEKAEDILHIAKCKAIEANNLAKKREKQKETLSFSFNDEEDEDDEENEEGFNFNIKSKEIGNEEPMMKKRFGKNPEVDTSFLPDRDREEQDAKDREVLRVEWEEHQSRIKNEQISITYSYWDGSGHRRDVTMNKGNTISQFLQRCLSTLKKEFNELKIVNPDQLMYIKEDLIIAHHYSFYDFIVTKARGKSGPLFNFDVHGDIRISSDASIEKDESHAGKICLRSWYDRNKHIFPASRWEPYNPEKEWTKYTVSDKEAAKIVVK